MAHNVPSSLKLTVLIVPPGRFAGLVSFVSGVVVRSYIAIYGLACRPATSLVFALFIANLLIVPVGGFEKVLNMPSDI